MDFSVASTTITHGSETQTAALVSKATHQATVAAKSILMSGGTEVTALSTANAAALSVLSPKNKGFHMSRRKAKRHAEVVSSIALMSAITSIAETPRDLPPNVEFETEPMTTPDFQHSEVTDDTTPQKSGSGGDESSVQTNNKTSATSFGAAVMRMVRSTGSKQEKNVANEPAVQPLEEASLPDIVEGEESCTQDSDDDNKSVEGLEVVEDISTKKSRTRLELMEHISTKKSRTRSSIPQVGDKGSSMLDSDEETGKTGKYSRSLKNFPSRVEADESGSLETASTKKNRLPYFARKSKEPKTKEMAASTRPEPSKGPPVETSDLASEIPLTDPIYTSPKAVKPEPEVRKEKAHRRPKPKYPETPASLLSPATMQHLEYRNDSYSTYSSDDDDDDSDVHFLVSETFDSEPFANPTKEFVSKNMDPFLASLTDVFTCGSPSPGKRSARHGGFDSGEEDELEGREEIEERGQARKHTRTRESSNCYYSLFNRKGESMSTVDSEDVLKKLNSLSSEADAAAPRQAPPAAPAVPAQNPSMTMETVVLQSFSGSNRAAKARISVVANNGQNTDEQSSQERSRERGEGSASETRDQVEHHSSDNVSSRDEPATRPEEKQLSSEAIAEFKFPETGSTTSSKKPRGFRKLFSRRKVKK